MKTILFAYIPSFLVAVSVDAADQLQNAVANDSYRALIINAILSSLAAAAGLLIKEVGKYGLAYLRKVRTRKFGKMNELDNE